jgi:hypothetical protein
MTDSVEPKERFSAYHVLLLSLLSQRARGVRRIDADAASVDVRATLHIGLDEWGTLYAITRGGMIASFFFDVRRSVRPPHVVAIRSAASRSRRPRRLCGRNSSSRCAGP